MGKVTFLQQWKLNRIDKVLAKVKILKQDIERLEKNLEATPLCRDKVVIKKNIKALKLELLDCSAKLVRLAN